MVCNPLNSRKFYSLVFNFYLEFLEHHMNSINMEFMENTQSVCKISATKLVKMVACVHDFLRLDHKDELVPWEYCLILRSLVKYRVPSN